MLKHFSRPPLWMVWAACPNPPFCILIYSGVALAHPTLTFSLTVADFLSIQVLLNWQAVAARALKRSIRDRQLQRLQQRRDAKLAQRAISSWRLAARTAAKLRLQRQLTVGQQQLSEAQVNLQQRQELLGSLAGEGKAWREEKQRMQMELQEAWGRQEAFQTVCKGP